MSDYVTGQLSRSEIRQYARVLYAATRLAGGLPAMQDALHFSFVLASAAVGRRLLATPQQLRILVARTILTECLVLCRDDEPLLELGAVVYDVLDALEESPSDQHRALAHDLNRMLAMA